MTMVLTAAIAIATLVAVLTRPRGYSEGVWALAGGLLMLATGRIGPAETLDALRGISGVVVFLFGLFWLSLVASRAGLIERAAQLTTRMAGGNSHRLLFAVFALGTVITALLSNDATVVLVTPVVLHACRTLRLPPLPFLFACTFVADTASSLLPVSNPINVLFAEQLDISFERHVLLLALPTILAVLVNAGIVHLIFRKQIPRSFDPSELLRNPRRLRGADWLVLVGLVSVAVGYVVGAVTGIAVYWITLTGGLTLGLMALLGRRVTARELVRSQPPALYAFVAGLAIVVAAADEAGLLNVLGSAVARASAAPDLAGLLALTFGTAFGTNLVNNWTMALAIVPSLARDESSELLVMGALLGADIGPNLSVVGSLATLIWLTEVRREGLAVSARTYLGLGIVSTVPALFVAVLALWLLHSLA